ncbi:MAG: hypothetical protein AAF318_15935 [Pseudomonadota bacterium]
MGDRLSLPKAVALLTALALGGCGAGVLTPAKTVLSGTFNEEEREEVDPDLLRPAVTCPPVRIQAGTEALRREGEAGNGDTLRWQASILKTARACTKGADGTAIRVGISGRVIEGPRGAPSSVTLPVRVAVRENSAITYSRLHNVAVSRDSASQDWAFVDEAIVVDNPAAAEIVVGFDG